MSKAIVTTQGNFFDHRNENFAKGLNGAIQDISASIGPTKVKDQLYRGHGFRTGFLKGSVGGGLVKNLHGRFDAGKTIKGKNVNYAIFVEARYKMFRNALQWLQKQPTEVVDVIKSHVYRNLN